MMELTLEPSEHARCFLDTGYCSLVQGRYREGRQEKAGRLLPEVDPL